MASIIRFINEQSFEEGLKIFQRYGETVPTEYPETYYVSGSIIEILNRSHVSFEFIDAEQYQLAPVTEEMFAEIRQSLRELKAEKVLSISEPESLDDLPKP